MADQRPKIFIGSSTQGYATATKIKDCLSDKNDCTLWKDPLVWEANKSTFDNLLRMVGNFDFGIFVATADDLTLANDKIVLQPRDNVILEMALFLGAMGQHKSFLLVENGVKLPTDFAGIYMPRFDVKQDASIIAACEELKNHMEEHFSFGHLSLYPTTALALGYFKNFIAGVVESAHESSTLHFDGNSYSDFKFRVVIPADLNGSVREKAAHFYRRHGFQENAFATKFRKQPAWFQLEKSGADKVIMYDMPTTLSSVDDAIEMILQKGFKGRTKLQEILEQRELNNFRRVLQIQIDSSPFAKSTVEIIDEF